MLKIKENHETFQNYGLCLLKTDRQTNQTTYRLDLYMPYESSQKIQLSLFNSSRENHVSPMTEGQKKYRLALPKNSALEYKNQSNTEY